MVRDALAGLGVGPADLATVVVTHIHLDHAGGTGDIAADVPRRRGRRARARRAAPGRPVAADGQRADGVRRRARRSCSARWRRPRPSGSARSTGTGAVDLGGGRRLDSHYAPGHARHHVGADRLGQRRPVRRRRRRRLHPGDRRHAAGHAASGLRPGAALESLRTFAALRPTRLLFSHYGPVDAVTETLDRSAEEISVWVDETRRARDRGLDLDHAVAWWPSGPGSGTRCCATTPTPPWPQSTTGPAAPPPTWPESCTTWIKTPRIHHATPRARPDPAEGLPQPRESVTRAPANSGPA